MPVPEAVRLAAALSAPKPVSHLIEPLLKQVDDPTLVRIAGEHGLSSLVHRGLRLMDRESPPELDARRRPALQGALALAATTLRLQERLSGAGITSLAYKGPSLVAEVYGDLGLRPSGDVDLIVRRTDAIAARTFMIQSLGMAPEFQFSAAEERETLHDGCEFNFTDPRGLHVEIHWQVLPRLFAADVPVGFERARAVPAGGVSLLTLDRDEVALALCAHGTKHAWSGLRWVADIAWLIAGDNPADWERVLTTATEKRIRRMVLVPLWLCRSLFGVDPPPAALPALTRDRRAKDLAMGIRSMLLSGMVPERRVPWLQSFWTRVREHPTDRARVAARILTDPTVDFRRKTRIPQSWDWANRPLRLGYVIGKYALQRAAD